MGLINCGIHGMKGAASMTKAAVYAFDCLKNVESIRLVELVYDEVSFFMYALTEELPFENTKFDNDALIAVDENTLKNILDEIFPRCGRCLKDALLVNYPSQNIKDSNCT